MEKLKKFKAKAIIFDKDGTLIDFDAMWGGWALALAKNLTEVSGRQMQDAICEAMGYDQSTKKVLANGKLAATPMKLLRELTVEVVQSQGFSKHIAEQIVEAGWVIPEPVELAKPLTDLRSLLQRLHSEGIKLAIATADDRIPTQAMLDAFDISDTIHTMVCADDGIKSKPAPDMILAICERLGIHPSEAMMVGDTTSDLTMARAAGAGLAVGVLSGVSNARDLIHFADVLIDSIDDLQTYSILHASHADLEPDSRKQNGLNPDMVY